MAVLSRPRVRFIGGSDPDVALPQGEEPFCDRCGRERPYDELERTEVAAPPSVAAVGGVLRLLLCAACRATLRKGDDDR